ncbi:MAG TPA: DCC1-like thiol-disulfide oxidoreductase family protein [Candidatus Bathyarchaeia archaeon]|nr:DCC1-like thiol-disulfide oxidoreductase family protein [Candidatus Bathyarchaeia archaeon]
MASHSTVFYDGACGLCHRAVRFALAHDADGSRFRFAPLGGEAFHRRVPAAARTRLPDSLVALTPEGALLTRSAAVVHVMQRAGGVWKIVGRLLALVPRGIRDAGYDGVARARRRMFERPEDPCPVSAPELRARFEP